MPAYTPMSSTESSPPHKHHVDVLVIGAGPAGLMCAHSLKRAGVNVMIVDKRAEKVLAGHADGIQPRTIEVLQSYGLAERLLREANQMHMAAFYNPKSDGSGIERTGRAPDVTAPTARYPFECLLHQGAIESIFIDSMASMGLQVRRPIVPTSIELVADPTLLADPTKHAVKVVLKHLDVEGSEEEVVHAKFVVGADGAHSWVRKALGIPMEGEQTKYTWGVLDIPHPSTNFPDIRNRCAIHSPAGSSMVIPREGDGVRLYVQLEDRTEDGARVDRSGWGPEQLMEVAQKIFKPFRFDAPEEYEWWTIYVIGQRVAAQFSVNERVFIAGDACHTHSPKAGQGMNASMNDTHNLSWKMTYVLRGWANINLLKTYELERRKYAQDLITFDRKFSALFSGKPRTEGYQDGVSHEEFLKAFQTFGGFTSGIGIHYSPSLITSPSRQSCAPALVVGQRLLPQVLIRAADSRPVEIQDLCPADTRWRIIVFAGDTEDKVQFERVRALAGGIERFLGRFGRTGVEKGLGDVFDVLVVSKARKEVVDFMSLRELFRSHWSKVLLDDVDVSGKGGGAAYSSYGIGPEGAIIVVRPDGYVGMVTPFEQMHDLDGYFAGFMVAQ